MQITNDMSATTAIAICEALIESLMENTKLSRKELNDALETALQRTAAKLLRDVEEGRGPSPFADGAQTAAPDFGALGQIASLPTRRTN